MDGLVTESLEIVKYVYAKTKGRLPVISKTDFRTPEEAMALLDAGAALVETHSQVLGIALRKQLTKLRSNHPLKNQRTNP